MENSWLYLQSELLSAGVPEDIVSVIVLSNGEDTEDLEELSPEVAERARSILRSHV